MIKSTLNFTPKLTNSQLKYRIELAEKRLESFPLDTIDFILVDMEHPVGKERHAHQCHTDLSGRTIEFLSEAHKISSSPDDTILKQIADRIMLKEPDERMLRRMMAYYKYSNDTEAFLYCKKICDSLLATLNECGSDEAYYTLRKSGITDDIMFKCPCDIEPIIFMYEMTGEEKYIHLAELEAQLQEIWIRRAHSHSNLTVMRSLQQASFVTGDEKWVEVVNKARKEIIEEKMPYADGSIAEGFPKSFRTEGCSNADWCILNLQYGRMYDDDEAYDMAEHTLYNAIYFNQFVTGGFGHRTYNYRGYGTQVEEAWWCCTQTCGIAMCEFAKHAVQLVDNVIKVNFLIPGSFELSMDGKQIKVTITTSFPEQFDAIIKVEGDNNIDVKVRIPYYVKRYNITSRKANDNSRYFSVSGELGHYIEPREDGYSFKYGPLLLASMLANLTQTPSDREFAESIAPEGYVRDNICVKNAYVLLDKPNENGFYNIAAKGKNPVWLCFDDGNGSHFGTHNIAPAYVDLMLENGKKKKLFLQPMMYQTSALILNDVTNVFDIKIKE